VGRSGRSRGVTSQGRSSSSITASSDGSGRLAASAGARVVLEREPGYGSAYLAGFAAARGRYIVMVDADLT
jgi:glycosyltransferase involved in cell wall biosynthesis